MKFQYFLVFCWLLVVSTAAQFGTVFESLGSTLDAYKKFGSTLVGEISRTSSSDIVPTNYQPEEINPGNGNSDAVFNGFGKLMETFLTPLQMIKGEVQNLNPLKSFSATDGNTGETELTGIKHAA